MEKENGDIANLSKRVDSLVTNFTLILAGFTLIIGLVNFIGYQTIKGEAIKIVARNVEETTEKIISNVKEMQDIQMDFYKRDRKIIEDTSQQIQEGAAEFLKVKSELIKRMMEMKEGMKEQ